MLDKSNEQWQISNTKYNEGLQELQSFRDALKPVIDTYKGRWYHQRRVRKMNAAQLEGRVEKHPRITDVEAVEAFLDTVNNPHHPKSATELASAFESYLKTGFNWAKLSPLRKKLKAALLKFRSTHNLELIDTKLLFPHDEADPQVPEGAGLDLEPVIHTDSESPEDPSDNLLEALPGLPAAHPVEHVNPVPQNPNNNNAAAPAAVANDAVEARIHELTATAEGLNAQLVAEKAAHAATQAQAAQQQAIAIDLGQQLDQRAQQIQQHQAEIVALDQRLDQAGAALNQAQSALTNKTAQVNELRAFAQAQEGLIAQQQVTIQQQKTLLEKLSEDFNTLTKRGFDLIRQYTNALAEACGLFKKAVSKPKKALFKKDVAQEFRDQARQQLKDHQGPVFEKIENSGPNMQGLINDFIATKGVGNRTMDELDTVVYPAVEGRVLPASLQDNAEEAAEVAAVMAAQVEVNAPRVFPAIVPTATVVAAPQPQVAAPPAKASTGMLASIFAPAPPAPPAPTFAGPPPAPAFNPPAQKGKTTLAGHPDSLINNLGANNNGAPKPPAAISGQDALKEAVTGGVTLKKTDHLAMLAQKKEQGEKTTVNPLSQGLMDRVNANLAAKAAREAKAAEVTAEQAALVATLSQIYAATHGDVDDWSDDDSLGL